MPYRLGWVEKIKKNRETGEKDVSFFNVITRECTDRPPNYRPEHDFAARKLQANWAIRRSRKYVMFRAVTMAVDCSILLLSYFISSGALERYDLLLSYLTILLASHNTIILKITNPKTNF